MEVDWRAQTRVDPSTGCWIWEGPHYGENPVLDTSRTRPSARRAVALDSGVRITENAGQRGPSINVMCGHPSCVNPRHLRWLYAGECPRYDEAAQMFLDGVSLEEIGARFDVSRAMAWTVIKRSREEAGWVDPALREQLLETRGRRELR